MDMERFKLKPVMGILRGVGSHLIEPLTRAVISAGLQTFEITMNTEGAPELIKKAVKVSAGRLSVGAGTVLDMKSLKIALGAGATFIVTPVFIEHITAYCVKNKIPIFPGALTPAEIYAAWSAGATMVKVFPAGVFGPKYFKEIKGPFDDIKLLACGGVTPDNMKEYFTNGADAISFGAGVFRMDWLAKKNFAEIEARIKEYLNKLD
jgi:2-dehydro-3-deoxyphosphogluconate aldolase/(4S)-4-hydroxy-2-oxoglutarate aldolase